MPLDGSPPRPVPGLGKKDRPIQWTEDGRSLYVRVGESPVEEVYLLNVETGAHRPWRELGIGALGGNPPALWWPGPLVSRDGKVWVARLVIDETDLYLVAPAGMLER